MSDAAAKPSPDTTGTGRARRILSCTVAACAAALVLAYTSGRTTAQVPTANDLVAKAFQPDEGIIVGASYRNDTSPPLRDMPQVPIEQMIRERREEREATANPRIPHKHRDEPDPFAPAQTVTVPNMPAPSANFDGIPFPGVLCNCAPPDTNGEAGLTQYVQMVNEGYQVFNKATGASVLGPSSIVSIWSGFGGACEINGAGDPVVIYDQLANRWVITQFAGAGTPTDECIAVSTTSDATGSWHRYAFHLGSNYFDYPHLGVWPDAYYMSNIVFNAAGTAYLGPQAFAFDRAAMLAGAPASFITPGITGGPAEEAFLPADLDGSTLPAAGAPATFVMGPFGSGTYKVYHFHVDFTTPGSSTMTLFDSPAGAAFTVACPTTRACVPESGGQFVDAIADRIMYRLAYRNFGDHEAVVGNFTVLSGGVTGIRWFELRGVTAGPVTVYQESTYQPDTDWRWMASAAMDHVGNLAVGFSASSPVLFPQIRYAGRLVSDPLNTLAQGEAHLFDGAGAQTGTGNRWGDYSDLTVDPVDDCTFWYTSEYYAVTSQFNWRTRIGSFRFPSCTSSPIAVLVSAGAAIANESCAAPNGAIDPGETVTVNFAVQNVGTAPTGNLVGTLQNTGGVTMPGGPQNYGAMAAGSTAARPFTFKAFGACGGTLTATLHLQDGAASMGDQIYTFTLGVFTNDVFTHAFDGVTAPALPAGWTSAASGSEVPWVTSTTSPYSAPNAAFAPDPTTVGNTELVTPTIAVPAAGAQLSFKNLYNMEAGFDGMVLEISINGGAFADITTGGNTFIAGGYNRTISTSYSSPIAGRQAWSGISAGTTAAPAYLTSTIRLPAAANGQNVQLKWRAATDTTVAAPGAAGVRIDAITIGRYLCAMCGAPFTDDPLAPGGTPIKAIHISELRTRINAVRSARMLPAFVFTDPTLGVGVTVVQAVHVIQLRTALSQAYAATGLPAPTYTHSDAMIAGGSVVAQSDIAELRTHLTAIE